jgi:hypothetical protein
MKSRLVLYTDMLLLNEHETVTQTKMIFLHAKREFDNAKDTYTVVNSMWL